MWILTSFVIFVNLLQTIAGVIVTEDLGCYKLIGNTFQSRPWIGSWRMTAPDCLNHCRDSRSDSSGYIFGGVSNGRDCHCGDTFPNQGPAEGECNLKCSGRRGMCGGTEAVNIYTVCSNGTYKSHEYRCNNRCGHCKDNEPCNQITGVCQDCTIGYFGKYCKKRCGCYYSNKACDRNTGDCIQCDPGYQGSKCNQVCDRGHYGDGCRLKCDNCKDMSCDITNGNCLDGCNPGWTGKYCTPVVGVVQAGESTPGGWSIVRAQGNHTSLCTHDNRHVIPVNLGCYDDGNNRAFPYKPWNDSDTISITGCLNSCRRWEYIFAGVKNGRTCECGQTFPNKGPANGCNTPCSKNQNEICGGTNVLNIYTVCNNGTYQGNNKYDQKCLFKCGHCKDGAHCKQITGHCNGCKTGWNLPLCKECASGYYGENCDKCGNCKYLTCDKDGFCHTRECLPGWKGDACKTECPEGYFGKCLLNCPDKCKTGSCNNTNGVCSTCEDGWKGDSCEKECGSREYGENCRKTCEHCNMKCNKFGICEGGCKPGWQDDYCQEACSDGFYGNCTQKCETCANETCSRFDGECLKGCADGWKGSYCNQQAEITVPIIIIGSGVAGFIVLVVTIWVTVYCCRKGKNRNHSRRDLGESDIELYVKDNEAVCSATGGNAMGSDSRPFVGRIQTALPAVPDGSDDDEFDYLYPSLDISSCKDLVKKENDYIPSSKPNLPLPTLPNAKVTEADTDSMYGDVETPSATAVDVRRLKDYIKNKKQEKDGFTSEFKDIPNKKIYPCDVAKKSINIEKNRYKDILPFDQNRVTLTDAPNGPNSDYINASYIDGYKKGKKFIATQGPKKTSDDFWSMVAEQNVSVIVMITNLVETSGKKAPKEKCEQYWPDAGKSQTYGQVLVENIDETQCNGYTVRNLKIDVAENEDIYMATEGSERTIIQYQFTDWTDKPDTLIGTRFLRLIRKIRTEELDTPIIVHCSAGIGRTGTYIALDILLDQAESLGQVDVFTCVSKLREQRMTMVQTLDQYTFIYDTMEEAVTVGDTQINCDQITERHAELKMTGLEDQYKLLQEARQELIIKRADREKVVLKTKIPGRKDFISAVFVPSYKKNKDVILTQSPSDDTMVDFWRMVYDYDITTWVMLFDSSSYWPTEGHDMLESGPFTISRTDVQKEAAITCCQLTLDYKDTSKSLFHVGVTDWSNGRWQPDNEKTLAYAYKRVQDWKQKNGDGRMVVMCNDNGIKAAMFAVSSWMFEMIDQEQTVDIYQITKDIISSKPEFLASNEQYTYLYEIAEEYVKNHYDNLG